MKIILIATLLFLYLLFELCLFAYKYYHLPQLLTIDQSDKTLGTGALLRYIAAGDSTGVGYGASSLEKTYTYQVAEFLAKDHTVEYKNIAVIGFKTQDVLEKQVDQIIAFKPDVVTISIGANDATHLTSQTTVLNNYKTIISKLQQGTSAKIYVTDVANFDHATVLPWLYYLVLEYRSNRLNPKIMALENDRVKIIDIHNFGWIQPPYNNRAKTYAADHFHPNDLGYQNWAAAFLNKMGK